VTGSLPAADFVAALARVESMLVAAEATVAAGGEVPIDDLERCVDALCHDSARVDDAARAAARMTLERLLSLITALEGAVLAKPAP
jgi:hypothetical protein